MKIILTISLIVFLLSCNTNARFYDETLINGEYVNSEFLSQTDDAEKALISGYLYAYGNECNDTITSVKCQVLNDLNITNECDINHINFLNDWFKNDIIMFYKLKNCPNLPSNSAIQNEIKHLSLYRNKDTLKINILVYGLNNSEEKNWNTEQTDTYLIKNNTFSKIETITAKNTLKSNCLGCVKSK